MLSHKELKALFARNAFRHDFKKPIIVVLRNTDREGREVEDTGMNNCDTVLLVDPDRVLTLTGRSYANDKWQGNQVKGLSAANYIASGYYKNAWRKGTHRGYRALSQCARFMIWRSNDMQLMDDDDWNQYAIVADNFHGWAPGSAGCVTVEGNMKYPTGDWKTADDWIYNTHAGTTLFSAAIFQHEDLNGKGRLRVGSTGEEVVLLQKKLAKAGFDIKVDGDFGPATHYTVRKYQEKTGEFDDGIIEKVEKPRRRVTKRKTTRKPARKPAAKRRTTKKTAAKKDDLAARLKSRRKSELLKLALNAGIVLDPSASKTATIKAITSAETRARRDLDAKVRKDTLKDVTRATADKLKGLSPARAGQLKKALGVKTIKDLGDNKLTRAARVLATLAKA